MKIKTSAILLFCALPLASCISKSFKNSSTTGYVSSKTIFWEPGEKIPVCFVNGTNETLKNQNLTMKVVKETYEKLIPIEFVGWDKCKDEKRGVHILISDSDAMDSRPGALRLGKDLETYLAGGHSFNLVLNLTFKNYRNDICGMQVERCVKSYALHEFGHVLGLEHESQRPDSTCNTTALGSPIDNKQTQRSLEKTTLRTAYDPESIMNYCRNAEDLIKQRDPILSKNDEGILKTIYTPKPVKPGFTSLYFSGRDSLPAFFKTLKAFFGDAQIVALGEGAHWMQTYHEMHFLIIQAAIEQSGFRVIAIELPWSLMAEINKLINDPSVELNSTRTALKAFESDVTISLLQYVRNWNLSHPTDQVTFAGFDAQQPFIDYKVIKSFAEKTDSKSLEDLKSCAGGQEYSSQIDWERRDGGRLPIDKKKYDICLSAIKLLRDKVNGSEWQLLTHLTSFQAAQENALCNTLSQNEYNNCAYGKRDLAMKKILDLQSVGSFSGKKQILWMHAWHAFKKTEDGPAILAKSIGSMLSEEYGVKFKNVLSLAANLDFSSTLEGQFHSARQYPGVPSLEHFLENVRTPYLFIEVEKTNGMFPPSELYSMETNEGSMLPLKPGSQIDSIFFVPFATKALTKR